eukprot:TRINITY_DN4147_c0_g1_i1.p1 TRINITY_DN4147_c0_g1~~TRINITY_DN4147_c0_g1_i1.p1  ORF type:complete len:652 (+),score=87.29 TRINITY_DN4147_c0_g1_i1:96-2051(+)
MIRRPPRSTLSSSSAASDVYKRQVSTQSTGSPAFECEAGWEPRPHRSTGSHSNLMSDLAAERLLHQLTLKQLKPICMRLNVPRSGRKQEIINRLIAACPNQRTLIQLASTGLATPVSAYSAPKQPMPSSVQTLPPAGHPQASSVGGATCYCRRHFPHERVVQCTKCRTWDHSSCVGRQSGRQDGYICAKCVAMKSSVFAKIHEVPVLGPFAVPPKSQGPQMGNLMHTGGSWKPILRFVRLDPQNGCWQIHHPYQASIWVNGLSTQSPDHKEANINRQYRKTDHIPVDLSTAVGDSQFCSVQVDHQDWEMCLGFVLYAEISSSKQLSVKIEQHSTLPEEECREMVKKSFGDDTDLMETAQRVSLRCILTRTKIKVPARGGSCSHLQCFDLENFLSANQWLRSSKCPLCNRTIDLSTLVVDGYVRQIIKDLAAKGLDFDDLDFDPSGNWSNPADKVKSVELLSDDDAPAAPQGSEAAPIELSDSDDDDNLPIFPSVLGACAPVGGARVLNRVKREDDRSAVTGISLAASILSAPANVNVSNVNVSQNAHTVNVSQNAHTVNVSQNAHTVNNAHFGVAANGSIAVSGIRNPPPFTEDDEVNLGEFLNNPDVDNFLDSLRGDSHVPSSSHPALNNSTMNSIHRVTSFSDVLYGDL